MEIITSSMKCICYPPILFFLYKLLFFVSLLQCSATDCLEEGFTITTNDTKTNLVSPGGVFEFGFFTPDEKTENSRYLGIWYHNQSYPKVIVWVANRDKPLLDSYGYLQLSRGQADLLDKNGHAYWSTRGPANRSNLTSNELFHLQLIGKSASNHSRRCRPEDNCTRGVFNFSRLCLVDDGNLILTDRSVQRQPTLWQSFNNPTDTFLPGMVANESIDLLPLSLNLISWQNDNNPAHGNFTFPLQLSPANNLYILEKGVSNYWQSGTTPFDKIPSALSGLWSNNSNPSLQKNTRLVMNFTGQIQLWSWTSERGWSLNWSEPKDGCSLNDKCGHFGSCNGNNGLLCKCLPGFKPTAKWKSGDFSGGCSQKSGPVSERNDYLNDIFLTLPMMKLANKTCSVATPSEYSCKVQCLNNIYCVAYFEGPANCSGAGTLTEKKCLTWTELSDLQEESPDGITILVRTTQDDIDPTSRGCSPCGTYIIPYPLSTGGNCGDPSYSHFHCNKQTGQVHFLTSSGNFRVNSIDPDKKLFSIQVMHNICDDRYIHLSVLSLNNSLPFTFRNCNVVENQPLIQVAQPFIEVEIGWNPPPEFSCRAPLNCSHWRHTTCKAKGGEMRCICGSKFQWNDSELECTRVPFPLKVVLLSVAGALAIILVCSILCIYHIRKRRMVKGQDSCEFKGDDIEGIDVPFFNWESILAATNNFADANKLGTGGFGSVYRGELPDGQIIAVKRLSSVSVEGIAEFKTEVMLIAKLQHRNLVRLIGYCTKADEKILVYEYMPNGSLDSCLFDERHSVYLDWKKRFDIILGIARGLLYLHQDSRLRIIHRDLKPSNILLDEELNPKISDFGIARIVGGKETEASTGKVVGTYGYMSPEYAYEGIFSLKSDVFSFGVVILETIRGKRNSRIFIFEHGVNLLGHAWKMWNEDQGLELMDPKLNESCIYSEVLRCIHIGLLCVQEDPSDRPSMSTVVHMLSAENASLPPAKQPAFMNRRPLSENASTSSAKDSSGHEVMSVSTVGRSRDCLEEGSMIRDGTSNSTLVSPGGVFELGFFTPGGNNSKSRFLGIWYNTYNDEPNSKIIVWVANRDKPLLDSGGSLIVKNGSAMVMDIEGVIYWSAEVAPSSNASYCLQDTGNLICNRMGERVNQVLWQSFDDPTDIFLQGMNGAEALTSWETSNNPALGNYTFLQIEGNKGNKLVIIKKGSPQYWENKVSSFDHAPPILSNISLKNISRLEGYNNTRLVMKFTGQVQFWKWESERGWSLKLAEPNDRCNLNKICGNFGSCNSNNGFLCTCLPGFVPSSPDSWRSGRFFEGCSPTSATCSRSYSDDVFFRMPMMKVIPHNNETNKNCTDACLKDCNCVAYSCGVATCTGTLNERCLMWSNEITGLQEEYRDGITIFIRSTCSIIELTSRNCKTCGIYVIPYPLSTSADCGDPLYADFHCNEKTGQVSFSTSKGTFNVTAIYPEKKRFFIQVRHGNSCDSNSIFGSSKDHSVYSVKNCTSLKEQRFLGVDQSFIEFEMGWKPPREPICSEHSECQAWPLTTCKSPGIGESRCICGSSYNWDGSNVKCTKVSLPLQVLIPCLAAVLASILLCVIFLIYHMQKSRSAKLQGSFEFKEDDPESIDVPFFNWETILDASNNFADANKLGAGGFGSVYRGKLPNGVEIAVKRLSSLSLQGIEEFRTEVKLIAKLQHRNLVRLLGYCTKANEKILVYEFLPNGSLDSCLFDERHSVFLDWKKRFDIILGIARGLLYLHQDSRLRIIHRDLKPSNILLDEDLNPKISDFGIARIVGGKKTEASTDKVVGTYGYMSPEYASEGIFSFKSDVFSFGVIILETICGKRNSRMFMFEHGLTLLGHAWKMWNEDQGLELIDPRLKESCCSEVVKCINIGLLCVQEDPSDRPSMSTVIHMLNSENTSLPLAKQPPFINRKPLSENASTSSAKDLSVHEVLTVSIVGR